MRSFFLIEEKSTLKTVFFLDIEVIERLVNGGSFADDGYNLLAERGRSNFFPSVIKLVRFLTNKGPIEQEFGIVLD